jgi:hypothetical protein
MNNDQRRRPTEKEIADAKAYGDAKRYLVERAEKRLAHTFDNHNREPMTMLALLNAAWDMADRNKVSAPERFLAMKHIFMNAVGQLTGSIVQEAAFQEAGEIPEDAWSDLKPSEHVAPENDAPGPYTAEDITGNDEGSVH